MIDPKRESMLIEQVLAGRKEVFAELVDAHKNKIYGLLRSMGAGHQDAQDYTQEAFVKAYRKLASYRLESSYCVLAVYDRGECAAGCGKAEVVSAGPGGRSLPGGTG